MRLLVFAEHLDAVRMDEIEMADERRGFRRVLTDYGVAAGVTGKPGQRELFAIALIELRDADL